MSDKRFVNLANGQVADIEVAEFMGETSWRVYDNSDMIGDLPANYLGGGPCSGSDDGTSQAMSWLAGKGLL